MYRLILDDAVQIADIIRCRATDPIHYDGNVIRVTLSIGAIVSEPGESAAAALARADAAMYEAERAGLNTVAAVGATGHR